MPIKDSGNVTITLARTTVAFLRSKKRGLETWDGLMLRLGNRRQFGLECIICGAILDTEDRDISPNVLAKENEWKTVYGEGVALGNDGRVARVMLGYVCPSCGDST